MAAPGVELLIILTLMIVNGLFAMSEMAVVSARKARLQQWAQEGNPKARSALEMANTPGRFLPTVQIGITLVSMLAGAFSGATLAERLSEPLSRLPWLATYSKAVSVVIVVVGITYLSLVIGELAPKRLALQNPERIACAVAGPMQQLSTLTGPLVRLLSASSGLVLRLLGIPPSPDLPVTEEEIKVLLEQATRAGVFEAAEQDMVEGVFRLTNRRVSALMTPRTEIAWLDVDDTLDEIQRKVADAPHARYPVCRGNLDDVLGVVRIRDVLLHALTCQPVDLKALLLSPLFVPESTLASRALELLKQSGVRMALIVDEHGSLQGLLTINDIVEEIVGDIEADRPRALARKDNSWLVDGRLPIYEFKALFGLRSLPGEERDNYQTLGGFIMMQLGRIPAAGDHFRWGGLYFEVLGMDGRRVDKVLVKPLQGEVLAGRSPMGTAP